MIKKRADTAEKILYFDCYSGISGDMALGALLDLGLEIDRLREMLAGLALPGYHLEAEKVSQGGLSGTRAIVRVDDLPSIVRHLPDILRLIDQSDLPGPVCEKSSAIFESLAEAEAAVHGIPADRVHFHEVGAVDAIVDIVGTSAALFLLEIDRIYCSPLPAGRGEVETAHGRLPLPAPATLELLVKRQAPIRGRDVDFELITPTGAAIVATLADSFGPIPAFNIEAIGYGAGSIDPGYPNYLRLLLGYQQITGSFHEEEVVIIETNIDDLNPEIFGYLMERLFEAGALDVCYTPVQMKKNRPAVQLTILSSQDKVKLLQDLIFAETSTLGLRLTTARKIMRPRELETVQTEWGSIRIKYTPALNRGNVHHFAPEYEDCHKIAKLSGLPLKEVYRIAEFLFRNKNQTH
ncbi:MAG: nickel pincer cofactor biosynthesis protein LarC [Clostridia bacterium]|nr:nickel pincer cofactor biosynthesis protein LarC [Clostridia bacterium]